MNRKYFNGLIIGLLVVVSCSCTVSQKILVGGCGWDKVAIVDKKSNEIEWTNQ